MKRGLSASAPASRERGTTPSDTAAGLRRSLAYVRTRQGVVAFWRLFNSLVAGVFFLLVVNAVFAASQPSFADMDKMSGVKGWNFGFPSFGDTLMQDYGGWRSSLASAGIGLIEYNLTRFQANLLDTPREGPRFNPFYREHAELLGAEAFVQQLQRRWF